MGTVDCWPECNRFCECINGACQPSQVQVNVVRFHTRDGRFLKARFGGGSVLEASNRGHRLSLHHAANRVAYVTSGDQISLLVSDSNFSAPANRIQVEYGGRVSRRNDPHEGPGLGYYVMGGPDTLVWVTTPFSSGYPGYNANDPLEWEFFVHKGGGGPIAPGDEVSALRGAGRVPACLR